jgi:hypothetical protein
MASEPLIGSKTKGFQLSRGGIRIKFPSTTSTSTSTSINTVIPLSTQLAFTRHEIPGQTYKEIVDRAIKTVSPGTSMYNTLLKEESQAIARAEEEGRTLRKLTAQAKAASTQGNTVEDAINLYNFWVGEYESYAASDPEYAMQALINASNARNQAESRSATGQSKYMTSTAKELSNQWKAEDAEFANNIRDIKKNVSNYGYVYIPATNKDGTIKYNKDGTVKFNKVSEQGYVLAQQYQAWVQLDKDRAFYLSQLPELDAKMPEAYSSAGLANKIDKENGLQELLDEQTAVFKSAPGMFVPIADAKTGDITNKVIPPDLFPIVGELADRTTTQFYGNYLKDEYGVYHKLNYVQTGVDEAGEATYKATANILTPDGRWVAISSDVLAERSITQDTNFYSEGSADPIRKLDDVGLKGRMALTGADITNPQFAEDVLNYSPEVSINVARKIKEGPMTMAEMEPETPISIQKQALAEVAKPLPMLTPIQSMAMPKIPPAPVNNLMQPPTLTMAQPQANQPQPLTTPATVAKPISLPSGWELDASGKLVQKKTSSSPWGPSHLTNPLPTWWNK